MRADGLLGKGGENAAETSMKLSRGSAVKGACDDDGTMPDSEVKEPSDSGSDFQFGADGEMMDAGP